MAHVLEHRFINIPFSAILVSFLIHLTIPTFLLTVKVLDHFGINLFPQRRIIQDAYQSFIQVDVVALPDHLINEKVPLDTGLPVIDHPQVDVKEEPKTTTPDDSMTMKDEKTEAEKKEREAKADKIAKEKEKIKDQKEALKKLKEEAKREQAIKALQAKAGKAGRAKVAGNVLSQGTSTRGAIGSAKDRYTAILLESIKQHFNIYLWQQKKGLIAEVEFDIFPTGRVRKKRITRASADPLYDSAILKAIDEAQPLPLPDDPALLGEEIHITFKP